MRALSGRIDLFVDDRPMGMERLPRAHTVRERLGRSLRPVTYGIHGLDGGPISVSYRAWGESILIGLPDGAVNVSLGMRKSAPFTFRGESLVLRVFPLRGRLVLEGQDGRALARGRYGLSYVEFAEYGKPAEPLVAGLAVGIAIRAQWSQAAVVAATVH